MYLIHLLRHFTEYNTCICCVQQPFLFQEQILIYLMSTFKFFIFQGELNFVGTQYMYYLSTNMPLHQTLIHVNKVNTCTGPSLKFFNDLFLKENQITSSLCLLKLVYFGRTEC